MSARCAFVLVAAFAIASCGDDASSSTGEAGTSATSSGPPSSTSQAGSSESSGDPTDATSTSSGDDGSSSGGFVPIDCTESCADQNSDAGIAVCYSCRCKNAMDGWLPAVEQLQCSEAEALPLYGVDTSGPQPQLVESATDLETCANPALLYETCHVGSKLGQLQQGDISVKWVCRSPVDGVYSDMGAILYNARTGASCWFDDIDAVTTDDNVPDLDLMEAGEDNLAAYLDRFYFTDGGSCTGDCHDADPFIYTPFFSGVQWEPGAHALGPHARVTLGESLAPIEATHLVSPEAAACATCHRIGSSGGCDFLSPDALGDYKTAVHDPAIVDAMDPGSPDWSLAYWMPEDIVLESLDQWMEMYGAAKTKINECCANPGVDSPGCDWEPIPAP